MSSDSFAVARDDLERLVALRSRQRQCSISWGVVSSGELVLTGGHAAEPDPVPTDRTIFRIASMTKSFTASSILLLHDRGLLRLDDVVADIAPEFAAVIGPTADSPAITVRHLMSMAGGLATDDVWADRHLDMSDDELDQLLSNGATFSWTPQTHGEYSNVGFAMLGRLILRLTGRRAQDFITDNILRPLAMDRTTWLQPYHDDWARPYDVVDGARAADIAPLGDGAIAPMGGLWSCVSDLAKWVAWFDDAFPPRDDPDDGPLCRASRREMQHVHTAFPTAHTAAAGEGDESVPERVDGGGYGFGLFVRHDTRFGHFVYHSGGLPGYGSNMRWLPGQRRRRDRTRQRHVHADVGDGAADAGDPRRPRTDPCRPASAQSRRCSTPRSASPCSCRIGRRTVPTRCSPTTSPSTNRSNAVPGKQRPQLLRTAS